jgi:oxaloacetate decarboxylase alpha subunit
VAEIQLIDVSIRDGNQSLWGATGLNTAQILQTAAQLDRVGFRAIDFTSSSHMAVAVRYFKNNPWERIRQVRAMMPRTPLQLRFIAWQQADPDFMRIVYRRLQENGIRRFIVLDPMHDVDAVLEAAKIVKQEGPAEVMAALTYTLSAVHDDAFYANFAKRLASSADVDLFYVKDPSGLLSPERARTLIPSIKAVIGKKTLEIHAHCTIGLGPLSSLVAADLGGSAVHVGIGPLGEGSSLPDAERMVANLRAAGHEVPINDAALRQVAFYWRRLARAEGLPSGSPQSFDASFLRHQIAGGVMTTTRRQLAELKLEHRMPEVIDEVERVRGDLGYPIMVTPFPQMVLNQALYNVIGSARYSQVSDQVIRYVMGKFGRPTRPVDACVEAAILGRPRARELSAEAPFPVLSDLRRQFGSSMDEEEFLLRAVMPVEQVDAMIAAGRGRSTYSPEASVLLKLLRKLAERPHASNIVVEGKRGLRIALHAGDHVD